MTVKITIALASMLLASAVQAGEVIDQIRARGTVVMAYRTDSVPLSYVDGSGKPLGFAVDLCQRLIDNLKTSWNMKSLTIKYLAVDTATRFTSIEQRQADMECGATTNNAERRKRFAFTIPHYITGARLMVLSKNPWERVEALENKRLVSTKSTTVIDKVRQINIERSLHMQILEADTDADAFAMVKDGRADAFAMDDVLLYGLASGQPHPADFKVIGRFLTIEPLAIMLSKNDLDFKAVIDREMKQLIRSGEVERLYHKWFMQAIPPRNVALNIPPNYLLRDFWKYPTDFVPF